MTSKELGLIEKYKVERVDGKPIISGSVVLEFADPIARVGIVAWARAMRRKGYKQVYEDVIRKLANTFYLSVAVGDVLYLDDSQIWEVVAIAQPYDDHGNMLEPIARLKKLTNDGPPRKKDFFKDFPIFELKRFMVEFPETQP